MDSRSVIPSAVACPAALAREEPDGKRLRAPGFTSKRKSTPVRSLRYTPVGTTFPFQCNSLYIVAGGGPARPDAGTIIPRLQPRFLATPDTSSPEMSAGGSDRRNASGAYLPGHRESLAATLNNTASTIAAVASEPAV